jgi:hypothetical protein
VTVFQLQPNLIFIVWDIGSGSKAVVDADGNTLLDQQKQFISQIIGNKVSKTVHILIIFKGGLYVVHQMEHFLTYHGKHI